jgi:hypothetical protein
MSAQRKLLFVVAMLLMGALPASAQFGFVWIQWLEPVATTGDLPSCATGTIEENRARLVQGPSTPTMWYCPVGGGSWVSLGGAGGTDDQIAAEVPFTPAGGVAATDVQAAIEEVDAEHTVDTDTFAGYVPTGDATSLLTASSAPVDGECAVGDATGNVAFEACGGGGIGGSTGAVDNALLLADGAGGALLKSAGADLVFSDALNRLFLQGDSTVPDFHIYKSNAGVGLKRWSAQNTGAASQAVLTFGLLNDGATGWTRQNMARLLVNSAGGFWDLGSSPMGPTILRLGSQATAPTACTIGDLYVDQSGAYCACTSTNTWENMTATGSCV